MLGRVVSFVGRDSLGPRPSPLRACFDLGGGGGGNNAVKQGRPGLNDHAMGTMSLQRLCLRWATWPYARTSLSVGNASIASHIFGHHVHPVSTRRDQSAQAFPVFTLPRNPNAHVTGKAWDRG